MSGNKVVPVVITKRSGEPDVISAFETAERAENSKIAGWAESFDFELTEPIIIDLGDQPSTDKVLKDIVDTVKRRGTEGIVAASSEYRDVLGLSVHFPKR